MLEKLPRDVGVALDRCGCEPLSILNTPLEVSGQILSRRGLDMGGGTNIPNAQELQQLCNRLPLDLSRRSTNVSVSMSTAVLIPLDLRFAKVG